MDDETFWNLIENCRRQTPDPDERVAPNCRAPGPQRC
ncbi:DUF4240 domain-containing protein [Streptomyces sp. NRRL F-525]|nr:DUF4240 domain-containing protein [Streptomyces sp. NRRL F-525]